MLTIKSLKEYGANVDEGLGRCMNNEAFYLRLVNMAVGDAGFERLHTALKQGDRKEGFEAGWKASCDGVVKNIYAAAAMTLRDEFHFDQDQIILLHDMEGNRATADALKVIVPELKKRGFRFVTCAQLFAEKGVVPRRGWLYSNALQTDSDNRL